MSEGIMEKKPFEKLAKELGIPAWMQAAVKQYFKLAAGQEMDAAELEAKVQEVNSLRFGY